MSSQSRQSARRYRTSLPGPLSPLTVTNRLLSAPYVQRQSRAALQLREKPVELLARLTSVVALAVTAVIRSPVRRRRDVFWTSSTIRGAHLQLALLFRVRS
jgi:hypothetical protein